MADEIEEDRNLDAKEAKERKKRKKEKKKEKKKNKKDKEREDVATENCEEEKKEEPGEETTEMEAKKAKKDRQRKEALHARLEEEMNTLECEGVEVLAAEAHTQDLIQVRRDVLFSRQLMFLFFVTHQQTSRDMNESGNGSELEVITCKDKAQAHELCEQIKHGMSLVESEE